MVLLLKLTLVFEATKTLKLYITTRERSKSIYGEFLFFTFRTLHCSLRGDWIGEVLRNIWVVRMWPEKSGSRPLFWLERLLLPPLARLATRQLA